MKQIMQIQNYNGYLNFNRRLAWILTILFLSLTCSLAAISGSHSFTNTYDEGETCDISGSKLYVEMNPKEENSYFGIATKEEAFPWNYLYLNIIDSNFETCEVEMQYINNGEVVDLQKNVCELKKGYNIIKLKGVSCNTLKIVAASGEKVSFTTNFIQLRENKLFFSGIKYFKFVIIFIFIFSALGMIVTFIYRRRNVKVDWYSPIDFLQDIYISLGNRIAYVTRKIPTRVKMILRIATFICWMFWIMFIYNMGKYMLTAYFKYNVLIFCVAMMLITASLIEKPLKKCDWNKPVVHAWFWLSICMCISEFFIAKRFCMIGYVNLIVFGFYYFVWNNLTDKNQVIKELIVVFKIAFFISVVITLLCRPRAATYGLIGHTWNPNIYGIFCAIALLTFISSARNYLIVKKSVRVFIIDLIGILVSGSFVLLAGSRAGIILAVPGILFFIIDYTGLLRRQYIKLLPGITVIPIAMIIFYFGYVFLSWATINLPVTQLVFPWDSVIPQQTAIATNTFAAEMPTIQSVIYNPRATTFLSGRNLYWVEYFREFNFFGHEYYPNMWGGARYPHNGILGIIYRYGVLAAVPYILMFVNAIMMTFKGYIRNRYTEDHAFYMWVCVIGISLCMLVENFERPFLATEWLWWYWCLGYLFISNDSKKCEGIAEV